ncbi:hypothetical protein [Mesorhizobium sp.]|uniref:hypothetical protein n=1 Tax=Mesorhizobium sp. TaxID=1871066 RepID=UPI00257AB6B0|nr:hypothetical protein [Mesorhizobium sp.]
MTTRSGNLTACVRKSDVQGFGNVLEVLAATVAQPDFPPHLLVSGLGEEVVVVGKQRSCSRQPDCLHAGDERLVARSAAVSVNVSIRLDFPQIIGLRALRQEHRRCDGSTGLSWLVDGDQLHVLATIGQLVEGRPSGHGQIDLEVKARRADRQLEVTRRNLLACTFDHLFDGLRQGRSMRRPITRRRGGACISWLGRR